MMAMEMPGVSVPTIAVSAIPAIMTAMSVVTVAAVVTAVPIVTVAAVVTAVMVAAVIMTPMAAVVRPRDEMGIIVRRERSAEPNDVVGPGQGDAGQERKAGKVPTKHGPALRM
jgi:hypothetical protein